MSEKKYTEEHEWVKLEGDTAIVGITDHAQEKKEKFKKKTSYL